jgi:hypothetical protein
LIGHVAASLAHRHTDTSSHLRIFPLSYIQLGLESNKKAWKQERTPGNSYVSSSKQASAIDPTRVAML